MWLQSYILFFKNSAKSAKKMRFRRVLPLLSIIAASLNHPDPHAAFLAEAALLNGHHFPVPSFIRAYATDNALDLKILEMFGYSTRV